MKNILLLKGTGIYSATRNYIDAFAKEFRNLGYNTVVVDIESFDYENQYRWVLEHYPVYATVDCQGLQNELLGEIKIFQETVRLHYFCDHPLYAYERIKRIGKDEVIINVDRENIHFLNKYYPSFERTAFIPLSGNGADELIPYANREIEVLFTGSYWIPEEAVHENPNAGIVDRVRFHVQKALMEHTEKTIESALEEAITDFQIDLSQEEKLEILSEFRDIETYVRRYYRDKIVRTLLRNGIKLSVYGEGWENLECEGRENLIILKGGAEVARRALGHAKIALNIMPGFKAGFQERIAAAMQSGTVVVTDTSAYIEEEFCDDKDIVLYHLGRIEELPGKIKKLLKNEFYAESIAEAGQRKAFEKHTWKNRVIQMAELIEKYHGQSFLPMQGTDTCGKMLEIGMENRNISHIIWEVGVQLSNQMNELNELYYSVYANKEDALRLICNLRKWDSLLGEKCNRSFFSGNNVNIFTEILQKMFEQDKDFERNLTLLLMMADGILIRIKEAIRAAELEEMLLGRMPLWDLGLCNDMLRKHMTLMYENSRDPWHQLWMDSIRKTQTLQSYPQTLLDKYGNYPVDMRYDSEHDMIFVMHGGKPLYYPKAYTPQQVYATYCFCCMEQDENSPHRYLDENFWVDEDSCVIDAGTAEGNFALDIVDRVKKIYLVECDEKWLPALKMTFAPYGEKVILVSKMLSNTIDEMHTTIDEIAAGEKIDFIKMDVEGAEAEALLGAQKTIQRNQKIKLVIATYHAKGMEERVKQYLRSLDFEVSNTEGYLFYRDNMEPLWDSELRHALVRAERNIAEHDIEGIYSGCQ